MRLTAFGSMFEKLNVSYEASQLLSITRKQTTMKMKKTMTNLRICPRLLEATKVNRSEATSGRGIPSTRKTSLRSRNCGLGSKHLHTSLASYVPMIASMKSFYPQTMVKKPIGVVRNTRQRPIFPRRMVPRSSITLLEFRKIDWS